MSRNFVRITSTRPDEAGYYSLRHERIFDGTNEALAQRGADVPTSAADQELLRRIGEVIGANPPAPGSRQAGSEDAIDDLPARPNGSVEEILDEIDSILEENGETSGGKLIPFPGPRLVDPIPQEEAA